jgi:hypothetical protein
MGSEPVGSRPVEVSTGQEKVKGQADGGRSELIVWIIDADRDGIAIALNDLGGSPNRTIRIQRCEKNVDVDLDLHAIVRDLIDDTHVATMYPFSLTIQETGSGDSSDARSCTVRFKFAENGSLSDAWRPLYDSAWTGEELECFAEQYQDDGGDQSPPHDPQWLRNLDWRHKLSSDLKANGDSPRVVILGPDTSDEVPALWFLLESLTRNGGIAAIPPIVSSAATWSALNNDLKISDGEASGSDCASAGREAAFTPSRWVVTLSRALGFSADKQQFRFATQKDKVAICKATEAAQKAAASFIQYAQPDNVLVDEIHHQMVGVRGYRRIAILYRDSVGEVEQASAVEAGDARRDRPKLARQLYGPALSDEFRRKNPEASGLPYLDSPFPKAPLRSDDPKNYENRFAKWEERTAKTLKPILRFFERERVEAVGVFGTTPEEKIAVMKIVRRELPNAQSFTSEPDWQLESPDPPGGGLIQTPVGPHPPGSTYPLNGLMIFAASVPDRNWVLRRFQELNELSLLVGEDQAFLPDVFDYYTAHIVKRLIDLAWDGKFELLREGRIKSPAGSTPCSLECFLRKPSQIGDEAFRKEEIAASGMGEAVLMLISDGRLRQISQPSWSVGHLVITLVLVFIIFGLLWLLRSDRPTTVVAQPPAVLTLWAWLFHGRDDSAAADGNGPGRQQQPPQGGSDDVEGEPPSAVNPRQPDAAIKPRFSRPMLATLGGLLFLVLPLATLHLDMWLGHQVSPSLLPDAHSVLPSIALFALVLVLALRLPDEFREEIEGRGRLRRQGDDDMYEWGLRSWELPEDREEEAAETAFDERLQIWKRNDVDANLMPDRVGWTVSIGLALALTLFDDGAGLPVPMGFTWALLFIYEWITLAAVISTALIFGDMARAVHRLQRPETFGGVKSLQRFLRLMDPESVRRLGTAFIGVVANGLLIFTLLLIARLSWLAMPRWRWDLVLGPQIHIPIISTAIMTVFLVFTLERLRPTHRNHHGRGWWFRFILADLLILVAFLVARKLTASYGRYPWIYKKPINIGYEYVIPLGLILFMVGLIFILGYWYYCYRTFRSLIQRVKDAKLCRLRKKRQKAVGATQLAAKVGDEQEEEKEKADRFEKQRQTILAIPEEPWNPVGARKAQVALSLALATPVVSMLLGPWSTFIAKAISSLFRS